MKARLTKKHANAGAVAGSLILSLLTCCLYGAAGSGMEVDAPVSPFQPDLTPGYVLIEGDIQVPMETYFGGPKATFGGAVTSWPSGVVPYDFVSTGGGAVSAQNQAHAVNAMNMVQAHAGVTFRPATAGDANRVRFQNSSFNDSPIGMRGGAQIINIVNWDIEIKICHELYHSLGFWHEQSRADRGSYVTIDSNNICGAASTGACAPASCCLCQDASGNCISCASNFAIQSSANFYGPYDFDSFMHYPKDAFSCNGNDTITVAAPYNLQWQNAIGQRDHFSYYDGITCRGLYPFLYDRWLDRTFGGSSDGSFGHPYRDANLSIALARVPDGGTLFIKNGATYSGKGTYHQQVTIQSPNGSATFGN